MNNSLEALIIEDSEEDTFLLMREISSQLPKMHHTRVETLDDLKKALTKKWDIILCDYNLPEFDGMTALHMIREKGIDAPFILVSGMVEEGVAASMLHLGANDYIMKDNLERLGPAVVRELGEAQLRKEQKDLLKKGNTGTGNAGTSDPATGASSNDASQGELLDLIELARKRQSSQSNIIQERHKAVVNILYVAGLIKKHQDKILENGNLTEQQLNVLRILKSHYPSEATINVVKEGILNKTTDVSRLIERMAKLEMIHYAKNDKDKRVRNITITEKGLQLLNEMNKNAEDMFLTEEILPEQDAKIINEKLKKLLDVMEN